MKCISCSMPMIATAILLGVCAAQTFTINGTAGKIPVDKKSQQFFVYGIAQEKVTDATDNFLFISSVTQEYP